MYFVGGEGCGGCVGECGGVDGFVVWYCLKFCVGVCGGVELFY